MLRYVIPTFTACMLASTLGVFAQEQTPAPQKEQAQAPEAATLTGCVQEAKTTDGGTAYLLNKAEGGTATMYVLIGPPPTELASHVNHKVEVTGQVHQPSAPAATEEGAPKNPNVLRPPSVQIESVKMIAETCK